MRHITINNFFRFLVLFILVSFTLAPLYHAQAIEQVVILIVTEDGAVQTFVKDKKDYLPLLEMAIKDFNETNN